jgi:2-keto-3-deoxy-L-rhamnonate aldolase RhmA
MAVKKLRSGGRIVGTMVRMIRNPAVAQIAKNTGLDFVMIDMEHGAYSIETFSDMAQVARSIGLGIFVRVPELSKGYISRIMDAGAEGVMVPGIRTHHEVKDLINWSRYTPTGTRGLGVPSGHTGYGGMQGDPAAFMAKENDSTIAIAQIETKEAVDNINNIASLAGLDVLLIGPNDLSVSLGVPGKIMGNEMHTAITKVADAAKNHGKIFAMHSGDALLERWESNGLKMIMSSLDISILEAGFSGIVKKYKNQEY